MNQAPTLDAYKETSSTMIPESSGSSLMKLLNVVTEETDQCSDQHSKKPLEEGELQGSFFSFITTTEQL